MATEVLEDQVVLFVDLLGFSESVSSLANLQSDVLALLTDIASLKSDFISSTQKTGTGTTHSVRPSVSTFSDHIVASYSISKIEADDDRAKAFIILSHLSTLVSAIAVAALSLGFLIRGGVSFGKLYHSGGVVFGHALIDAVALESRTAIYPRIVLSKHAGQFFEPSKQIWLQTDFDGIAYIDYYRDCVLRAIKPGDGYTESTRQWFSHVAQLLHTNLKKFESPKHTNQYAKWFYFSRKLSEAMSKLSKDVIDAFGIDPTYLPKH